MKRNSIKKIGMGLTLFTFIGMCQLTPYSTVKAAPNDIGTYSKNNNEKITDTAKAIQVIQTKYLDTDSKGLSYIKDEAKYEIDKQVLDTIKNGTSQVNKMISNGELKVDVNTKTIKEEKVVRQTVESKSYTALSSGSCALLSGDYIWHWYGFDLVLDAANSNIASIQINTVANQLAVAAGVVGCMGGISFTVGAGITAVLAYGWAGTCQQGSATGRGSIVYFMGKPASATLYNATIR